MERPDINVALARRFAWLAAALCLLVSPATAANLGFTVATSEPVVVTGTPRIAIDVGGLTRYATYASGSGTAALTFSYAVQAGDFDANGITLASPLDLNGGSITDLAGNPASALTFTLPDTSALKVQTYTTDFTTSPITNANANAVSFAIAKAPTGASFTYTITSSGGSGSVTGSDAISGATHAVSGVDVSALPSGTLTLSVTVSTPAGGTGAARTNSATPTLTASALDGLSAAAAYSTRRLRSAYAGPLLRVRRSTDDATQDIGATVGGNLDATALASFCGSASCFVSTWYDQSGNGRDAAQSTPGSQPRFVTSGVTELLGSRPAVRIDTNFSLIAPNALSTSDEFTASMTSVERVRTGSVYAWALNKIPTSARVMGYIPFSDGNLYFDVAGFIAPYRIFKAWTVPTGTPAVVTFQTSAAAGTRGVYVNGSLFLSGNGYADASDRLRLGGGNQGHFGEFILFPSSIASANRLALERNQGAYFGVTVP